MRSKLLILSALLLAAFLVNLDTTLVNVALPALVRDLHATMLYLLGFDYRRLNYPYQGLDQKLTGVKPARIVSEILA